jgi:hypothetical protein
MPVFNNADAIYFGASAVDRIAQGSTEIWVPPGPPSGFAVLDVSRQGIFGRVTFSNANKTVALTSDGSTEYGTAALTNPVDFSAATGRYIEIGVTRGGGGFGGIGPASSGSALNAVLGFLGESSVQFSNWEDISTDSSGEINCPNNKMHWELATRLKIYVASGKYWLGEVATGATGWWNPSTLAHDGNPLTPTPEMLNSFPADNYSIAVSTVSNATFTVYADPAEWLDTPPAGAVAFLG